jgi:hypothetical protein
MSKNEMTRKRTSKRSQVERAIKEVEALLAVERMENEADYRLRGRRFEPLTDADLEGRWLKCLRRELNAVRLQRTEMQDIGAELSLRGINNVKLPPDLLELVTADARKIMRRENSRLKSN